MARSVKTTQWVQHQAFVTEDVAVAALKSHPRNYRKHPADEIAHLMESLQEHGVIKNVVIARDGTILAGHGVVEAATQLGLAHIPVYRTDYEPMDPKALKLLAADNEIGHLAEIDDRALSELLRELKALNESLLGTGYDDMMLANLAFVTRKASEIADLDEAQHWAGAGMPEYDEEREHYSLVVNFETQQDRDAFCQMAGFDPKRLSGARKSFWWPLREDDDVRSVRFTDRERDEIDG